jgi:hypothetical protein
LIRLFFIKLSAIILPVGLLVCLCNYFIDPANIFISEKYVSGIATILSSGHNVDNISNYNERLLQEQMISRLTKTPDIVILGSSRIMEIGSDFFPGKRVLNCGVSHANIHDLISLTGMLDSLGRLPGEIYMNVDPGLISNETTEWQSIGSYYRYFLRKTDNYNRVYERINESIEKTKWFSLVSFAYFKESLDFLISGRSKIYVDVGSDRPYYGRFSDGTIGYSPGYTNPDTLKVASDARNTGRKGEFLIPDPEKEKLLSILVSYLKEENVKVYFIMLPYHPDYYSATNTGHQNIFEKYDQFYRKLAYSEGIPVIGNFNPFVLPVRRDEFYDMYHSSKGAIKKIFLIR